MLGEVLGDPLVGGLGQHEFLHVPDLHAEICLFGRSRGRSREGDGVAGGGADEVIVEALGDPAAPDLVQPVLGVQPRYGLAAAVCLEIHRDVVTLGSRALHHSERAVTTALGVDGLLHLGIGGLRVGKLDTQSGVARDRDRRAHLTGGIEGHETFLPTAGDLDVGGGDQVDLVLTDRLGEVLRNAVPKCLLTGGGEADSRLENLARGLTGTEPGKPHLEGQLAERGVDVLVELGVVDLDGQLDLVSLEGFQCALHRRRSVTATGGFGGGRSR